MFDTTACDLRYAAHTERVARVDRTGRQQTAAAAPRSRLARVGTVIARVGRLGDPPRPGPAWPPRTARPRASGRA